MHPISSPATTHSRFTVPDRRAAAGRGLVYRLGFGLPLMLPLVLLLGACCTEQALGFNSNSVLLFAPPSSRLVPRPACGVPLSASAMPLKRGLPPPLPPPPSSRRSIAPLRAWPTGRDPKSFAKDFPQAAARVSITILATLLTYVAHTNQRCGPVLASAGATLAASLVAPGLGQAAMCGTFSGMSSTAILPSVHWALGAGVLTSVLYEVLIHARNAALGLGGRCVVGKNKEQSSVGVSIVCSPSSNDHTYTRHTLAGSGRSPFWQSTASPCCKASGASPPPPSPRGPSSPPTSESPLAAGRPCASRWASPPSAPWPPLLCARRATTSRWPIPCARRQ